PEEDRHPHHEQQRQHHDEQERAPPTVGVAHAHTDRQTQDDRPADTHDDEPDRTPPVGGFGDVRRQRQTQHGQQCATRGGNDPSQQQNQVRRTEDRDEVPGDENKEGDQGHPLTVRMPGQVQKDGPTDPEHDREDRDQQAGTPHTHTQIQRDQIQDPADDQLHHAHHEGDRREQVHTLVQYGNAPQDHLFPRPARSLRLPVWDEDSRSQRVANRSRWFRCTRSVSSRSSGHRYPAATP